MTEEEKRKHARAVWAVILIGLMLLTLFNSFLVNDPVERRLISIELTLLVVGLMVNSRIKA